VDDSHTHFMNIVAAGQNLDLTFVGEDISDDKDAFTKHCATRILATVNCANGI
jgi:hypothetical protein